MNSYKNLFLISFLISLLLVGCEDVLDSISDPENNPVFFVNTTDDTPDIDLTDSICGDANGNCSFRAAIQQVNANPQVSYEINLGAETYTLDSVLEIKSGLLVNIEGSGMDATVIKTSDKLSYFPTLIISTQDNITLINIRNLTISDGRAISDGFFSFPPSGGGLIMNGNKLSVTLEKVKVKKNEALYYGGGIANFKGRLFLKSSIIEENTCERRSGAGIYNESWVSIENSAIVKNKSGSEQGEEISGAGIHNTSTGRVQIINSTISSNVFQGFGTEGVAIYNSGKMSVRSSTIAAHNTLSGIFNDGDSLKLLNTAVYDSEMKGDGFYSLGGNFIDYLPQGVILKGSPNWTDISPSPGDFIFPFLGPLTYTNDTWVHIPEDQSPLIDNASSIVPGADHPDACLDTDQRGISRSGLCDVGAVETN